MVLLPRLPPAGSGAVLQTVLSYLPAAGQLEQLEGLSPLQLRLQYSAMLARWVSQWVYPRSPKRAAVAGHLWGMARQRVCGNIVSRTTSLMDESNRGWVWSLRLGPAGAVLQTVLSYLQTAGPLNLVPAPPTPAPVPAPLLTYSPTAGLEQLVLLLTMLLPMKMLGPLGGGAPPWAVVAAAVVAVPAASCLPTAGSEAPQWAVVAAVTVVVAAAAVPSCPPTAGSEAPRAVVAASTNG